MKGLAPPTLPLVATPSNEGVSRNLTPLHQLVCPKPSSPTSKRWAPALTSLGTGFLAGDSSVRLLRRRIHAAARACATSNARHKRGGLGIRVSDQGRRLRLSILVAGRRAIDGDNDRVGRWTGTIAGARCNHRSPSSSREDEADRLCNSCLMIGVRPVAAKWATAFVDIHVSPTSSARDQNRLHEMMISQH